MATLFFSGPGELVQGQEIRGDAKSYGPASPEDVKFSLDTSISNEAIRVASSPGQSNTMSSSTAEAGLATARREKVDVPVTQCPLRMACLYDIGLRREERRVKAHLDSDVNMRALS